MNVRQSLILITSLLLVTSLSGCSSFGLFSRDEVKPVEVMVKAEERTPLNIAMPDPIKAEKFVWVVVTRENFEEQIAKIEAAGQNPVLFSITTDDYQTLSLTVSQMRILIAQQREIILKYKEYYEPTKENVE